MRAAKNFSPCCFSVLQTFHEFGEVLLPNRGLEKCVVAARLIGKRQQNKFPVFYFLDFLLRDSELRRIPEIFLRIDEQHFAVILPSSFEASKLRDASY